MRDKIIQAMKDHAIGHIKKHKMNVDIYFDKAVGVGGEAHPDILETIEKELNIKIKKKFVKKSRVGDHIWYISNNKKFMKKYPKWKQKFNIRRIILDLIYN